MSTHPSSPADSGPLAERMRAYGCPELIRLDEPLRTPEQIEYLDLLPRRESSPGPGLHAVAEHQGAALLYVVDACGGAGAESSDVRRLQRQLANRSDPAWLGVARPGSLELHPVGFHEDARIPPVIREGEATAPLFFQSLVHGSFEGNDRLQGSDYVFEKIYDLLTRTLDTYVRPGKETSHVEPLDVLSMAGRALFFRFLVDREIVLEAELQDICPAAAGLKETFADAEKAAQTSAWLDETFNGDFLRLVDESIPADRRAARQDAYLRYYKRVERSAGRRFFHHLHAILNGWRAGGDEVQSELDWGDFDFAHIPVGVLSQVYESFSHRADHPAAKETSVHYTPRNVARLMVDQAFAAVEDPARARVLDPTCGAGIFLVLAFRRLVAERWRRDGERPKTRTIQKILYGQLRGFDLSEPALRLAALALYVTAIELDGKPRPPMSLKFPRDLRDTVLFHVGGEATDGFTLGSLGPAVPKELDGTFDVVIGNPPWTRLREKDAQRKEGRRTKKTATDKLNEEFTGIGRRVLRGRGFPELAETYKNPDKNPDVPFVWRAMEWAREDAILAFALPARIFGHRTGIGHDAWQAILGSLSITGLINGSDLRKTAVWESVDVPFCLLFARNAIPPGGHRFYYSTPSYEPSQNLHARFRIDYEATRPVSVERVERQPWVLKTLALGTWRDVDVMERLSEAFPETLESRWEAWNPEMDKTEQGYNRSPGLAQKPARFLGDLPVFERPPSNGFSIECSKLETYLEKYGDESSQNGYATAHRPRTEDLYQPPLVIIPQSPGDDPQSPKAFLSSRPVAFSQSYYGYSCTGHSAAETLAALLYVTAHSNLLRYFVLMTSSTQGANRMMFTKSDLDNLPFPDVTTLSDPEKETIGELACKLEHDADKPWDEIDSFLFRLYGLDEDDVCVVHDTLFSAAPYRRKGRAALEQTTRQHREPFRDELRELLDPYFDVCGEEVRVEDAPDQPDRWKQPWFFLVVSRAGRPPQINPDLLRLAMEEANKRSASRIMIRIPENGGLLLGLLNQRRWWTVTRARLCAQHVIRHHLEAFGLTETV